MLLIVLSLWIALSSRKATDDMSTSRFKKENITHEECNKRTMAVQDALYVLNGKWKMPIIIALAEGNRRFTEIQRTVNGITPKVLSKELKEMELNELVLRSVYSTVPVTVEYELTPYSESLQPLIVQLMEWGLQHRERLLSKSRMKNRKATAATS